MEEILKIFILTFLQNASFTLVSRARNSKSISYNAIASILSNGIWLLVLKNVITNFDKPSLMFAYVFGSTIGSTVMHYIVMKYFEKK
jgi:uncharacterized protein YebE (UPF0316 family)